METGKFLKIDTFNNIKFHTMEESGDDFTVSRKITGISNPGEAFAELRAAANNKLTGTDELFKTTDYGYFRNYTIQAGGTNGHGGQYDQVEINTIDLNVEMKQGYYSTFTATNRTNSEPMEAKTEKRGTTDSTYVTWWNNEVRGETGLEDFDSGQLATLLLVTDGKMPSALAKDGYYWARTNQATSNKEEIYLSSKKNKRGRQSFLYPHLTVQENIYARKESSIKPIIDAIGFLKYPKNHAGKAYDDSEVDYKNWLISDAAYKKVFGWFEGTVTYKFSPIDWDTELYPKWVK